MDGMKFSYEGIIYDVPCMPKKQYRDWMIWTGLCCRARLVTCQDNFCYRCVYHQANAKARKAFYYECFPEEKPVEKPACEECANYKPKEEPKKFSKLTQEVFEREDCPEWAQYAAVDKNGEADWYEKRPISWCHQWYVNALGGRFARIEGKFDATDWEHSLIEREIRYVSCSSLKWPTLFKYSKLKDTYYVQIYEWAGPEWHILGTTTTVDSVPFDVVDVAPEFKDPAALVGIKVKSVNPGRYEDQVFMIIQAGPGTAKLSTTGMDYGIDSFVRDFVKLDGSLVCTFKEY